MEKSARILDGCVLQAIFAADNEVSERTIARYRGEENGLPFVEWGGKIYIPIDSARHWLRLRVKRRNPLKR